MSDDRLVMTDRVAQALGIDAAQLKKPGTAAAKGPSHGLILNPTSAAKETREVREFLSTRQPAQTGTMQVFVRIVPK